MRGLSTERGVRRQGRLGPGRGERRSGTTACKKHSKTGSIQNSSEKSMFLLAQHPDDTEHSRLGPTHRISHLQTTSQAVSRGFQCFWNWLAILPLAFLILCKAFCASEVET